MAQIIFTFSDLLDAQQASMHSKLFVLRAGSVKYFSVTKLEQETTEQSKTSRRLRNLQAEWGFQFGRAAFQITSQFGNVLCSRTPFRASLFFGH
jgi:hypothetical protein